MARDLSVRAARESAAAEVREGEIVDLDHDGRGVAREAGKTVFIDGALPGERVRYRTLRRRRQWDEAELVEVVTPSSERAQPRCAHFGLCGGCALQHLSPAAQLAIKQRQLLDNLHRIGRVQPDAVLPPITGPAWAYRRRARLGVKHVHKKGRVLAGFREKHKPYIADLRRCEILIEPLGDLPAQLAALVETLEIRDRLPQVEVAAGDSRTALVFRVLDPPGPADRARLTAFGAERGVEVYLQTGGLDTVRPLDALPEDEARRVAEGDPILGAAPAAAAGAAPPPAGGRKAGPVPPLQYTLDEGRVTVAFEPVDFIQINREVNVAMVDAAMRLLAPGSGDAVLDLFCGLGNFTLPLARRAARVTGVEGDASLVERARGNAARNGLANVSFHADNLFEPAKFGAWADARYDGVLIDPPRAGASEALQCLSRWRPRRVVYVSCHPASLARDAEILVHGQGFRLVRAGVMDMFPHTTHVESIAVFEADVAP